MDNSARNRLEGTQLGVVFLVYRTGRVLHTGPYVDYGVSNMISF